MPSRIDRHVFAAGLLAICIALPSHAANRVFLLAGQSNIVGQGRNNELSPPYSLPQTDVNYWHNASGTWVDLAPGFGGRSTWFGPEVAFGRAIKDAYPDDEIYLVKYGVGGTALYNDWAPTTGPQYTAWRNTLNNALGNLDSSLIDYEISGMMWMQGESDAFESQGPNYEANLTNFIADVRGVVGDPDLPFIIGRVLDYYGGNNIIPGTSTSHADAVRAAQQTVAENTDNVAWFDTDSFQVVDPVSNPGHYGTQGQIDLGNAFAQGYLSTVPEPGSVGLLGAGVWVLYRRRRPAQSMPSPSSARDAGSGTG